MAKERQKNFDPLDLTWSERYSKTLERAWAKIPNFLGSFIATAAVFLLGSTFRAEWLMFLVHFIKYARHGAEESANQTETVDQEANSFDFTQFTLKDYKLEGLSYFLIGGTVVSYVVYLGVGGFLHWYYYVRQRDRPEEWKCQPTKWLSPELERHEILLGGFSLLLGSIVSGFLSCYISNGGWTRIYYDISEYGWLWYFLQFPVTFIWQMNAFVGIFSIPYYMDYLTYWHHRLYHMPFLYKYFHKLHHTYKQPTAFSVTAIHPVEFLHIQAVLISPLFLWPTHFATMSILMMYTYYHGIIDHSGINFKAHWWQPWQPACIFHDNHHQYFHVNFGFNIKYWDVLHGTYRKKDRIYREDLFYGQGKAISEADQKELAADIAERVSENPLAYEGNTHHFHLEKGDLVTAKKVD